MCLGKLIKINFDVWKFFVRHTEKYLKKRDVTISGSSRIQRFQMAAINDDKMRGKN